jgi:D-amino-acid dehydrogenase
MTLHGKYSSQTGRARMRTVIVLGGGMVGVSSAIHLQRRGWAVILIDRREPGRETSYGNSGVIQSEAVRPYAMPRDPKILVDIALGRANDVHYRLLSLPAHVRPLLKYWWHSAPSRYRSISIAYSRLVASATADHGELIRDAQADHLIRRGGYRVLHRDPVALDKAVGAAKNDSLEFGVKFRVLSGIELAQAESIDCRHFPGAIHWLDPWTVSDPGGLVSAYAELFQRLGGKILRGDANTLHEGSAGWSVDTMEGRVDAACVVVALGPWSPDLLRKLGYKIELVRKRGYHMHYQGADTLDLPLVDATFGYVIAPMSKGLRITTGAELTGADAPIRTDQLDTSEAVARKLLDLGTRIEPDPWFGTRPCSPDMLPIFGSAPRHRGLWMNFGHGHQGFTLGPTTGRLLAGLMNEEAAPMDVAPYSPARFG